MANLVMVDEGISVVSQVGINIRQVEQGGDRRGRMGGGVEREPKFINAQI